MTTTRSDSGSDAGTNHDESFEAFLQEATHFLESHAQRLLESAATSWGVGSDIIPLFVHRDEASEEAALEAVRAWQATKFAAGFGWIDGPAEFGGRELSSIHLRLFRELESTFDVPPPTPLGVGLGIVGPSLAHFGNDTIKDRYLRALFRADIIACQLFSEPGAGSDLASVSTVGERLGDEWRITGQKVWTSTAKQSDIGLALCRTERGSRRNAGLTMFLIDMKAPGVTVRPLRQMTGGALFNEIFLDDVPVPDEYRLGNIGDGWSVAARTLQQERAAVGAGNGLLEVVNTERLTALVRHAGIAADPLTRQALAKLHTNLFVGRLLNERILSSVPVGTAPGPQLSMSKLTYSRNMRLVGEFVSAVLGAKITADTGEWGTYAWTALLLGAPALRILGGTEEIMKNILAERVLGLPRDPKF